MTEATIFAVALEKPTDAERAAFLADACAGDNKLRRRVEALLRAHAQPAAFLDPPVPATADYAPIIERPGTRIGPYYVGTKDPPTGRSPTDPCERRVPTHPCKVRLQGSVRGSARGSPSRGAKIRPLQSSRAFARVVPRPAAPDPKGSHGPTDRPRAQPCKPND